MDGDLLEKISRMEEFFLNQLARVVRYEGWKILN